MNACIAIVTYDHSYARIIPYSTLLLLFMLSVGFHGRTLIPLINVEVGLNVEGGILWKKLMHNSNKRGVEGGKNLRNQ